MSLWAYALVSDSDIGHVRASNALEYINPGERDIILARADDGKGITKTSSLDVIDPDSSFLESAWRAVGVEIPRDLYVNEVG